MQRSLKRPCLAPPPILVSSLKKNKMTKIAKIITTIISWNLIIRSGGRDQPSLLQTQAVYAILAGTHINWADVILDNLGVTDILGHTLVITLLLAHFKISNSESRTLISPGLPFDSKSLTLMFHEQRRPSDATSSSHPTDETPTTQLSTSSSSS